MASEKFFDWVLSLYRGSLRWVLDHPALTLIVLFITIASNVWLIIKIPKGFFPSGRYGSDCRKRARPAGFLVPRHGYVHPADWRSHQARHLRSKT